jgi:phospholipid/cholesterol/gamma-HCH transport system substrate-binding protein
MQKRAPTLGNILVIGLFALSCFGLLLFLWGSFGGSIPLKPKGYRFTVAFTRTLTLAEQADVRISGVDVGHVVSLKNNPNGRTRVVIEIDHQYAPLRSNIKATLRQKTLLGETYVQLIPGPKSGPLLADNGQLANAQVESSTTLDDLLSTFDPQTRRAFQEWAQTQAASFEGRGEDLNAIFANLEPFVEHANTLVGLLASQQGAVTATVHNTGVVFNALSERDHQLQGLIEHGEQTFHATAQSSQEFADAFRDFPAFERNSQVALRSLDSFATDASPLLDQLRPAEQKLAPLLQTVKTFAPEFNGFLTGVGSLTKASKQGLPAFSRALNLLSPLLGAASPVFRNLDPFLQYTGEYVPELQAFFANITAATNGHDNNADNPTGPQQHYLRAVQTIGPESLAVYPQRVGSNRANPYFQPGAFRSLANGGLSVFSTANCSDVDPEISGEGNATVSTEILKLLEGNTVVQVPAKPEAPAKAAVPATATEPEKPAEAAHGPEPERKVAAPGCNQQSPFNFNGQISQFPHATAPSK